MKPKGEKKPGAVAPPVSGKALVSPPDVLPGDKKGERGGPPSVAGDPPVVEGGPPSVGGPSAGGPPSEGGGPPSVGGGPPSVGGPSGLAHLSKGALSPLEDFNNFSSAFSGEASPPDVLPGDKERELGRSEVGSSVPLSDQKTFDFCAFPESLKRAVQNTLDKEDCQLITSKELSQLKKLKILSVSSEQGALLSEEYGKYFLSLVELDISDNPDMSFLPGFVTSLSQLEQLNISSTGIKTFSQKICHLKNLTELIASHNDYENQEIPFHTFCLEKLKVLDMSHSSVRYIDEYIGQLSHLEEFYMSGNSLLLIPQMLSTLSRLVLVDFRKNHLKNEDLNTFQSCKSVKEEDKEACREDLSDSLECEAVHELPFQRGEPLRQMYTSLAGGSQELINQCENGENQYCP